MGQKCRTSTRFGAILPKYRRISNQSGRVFKADLLPNPSNYGFCAGLSDAPDRGRAWFVRYDFALEVGRNLTHASDSVENGEQEVALWFKEGELVSWERSSDRWIFEK